MAQWLSAPEFNPGYQNKERAQRACRGITAVQRVPPWRETGWWGKTRRTGTAQVRILDCVERARLLTSPLLSTARADCPGSYPLSKMASVLPHVLRVIPLPQCPPPPVDATVLFPPQAVISAHLPWLTAPLPLREGRWSKPSSR